MKNSLQKRLAHLGKTLALVALVIIAIVVASGLLRGEEIKSLFLTGVSLAVAAIESLPSGGHDNTGAWLPEVAWA